MSHAFLTLALNPAIDATIALDRLAPGAVNIARAATRNAGGKGVNVASCLADWGVDVAVAGLLGADNDAGFSSLFAAKGIVDLCRRIPGETRTNIKLVDRAAGETTDINLPGATAPAAELDAALAALREAIGPGSLAILSGSLPPGVPSALYAILVAELVARGARVVVDTAGPPLAAVLAAATLPHAIKPNRHELEDWAGRVLPDLSAVLVVARDLVRRGVGLVVVSLGSEGALFVSAEAALQAIPPAIDVQSTVGAGDALVAGLASGLAERLEPAALARRATGFAIAKLGRAGPNLPERAAVEAMAARVTILPL